MRHGTNGSTSLPKEGVLRIFSPWKIRRPRPGLNPANLGTKGQPPAAVYAVIMISSELFHFLHVQTVQDRWQQHAQCHTHSASVGAHTNGSRVVLKRIPLPDPGTQSLDRWFSYFVNAISNRLTRSGCCIYQQVYRSKILRSANWVKYSCVSIGRGESDQGCLQ